ncbi:hypothetical protein AG1IA_07115 [Rhizoctonia solani AG-1 IA]|uniref:Uncharacterized protein n=1 Tax=Thanatephorus cucumeris (strain AG1-IA) TaxID=983506 RepID=L8WR72_THACA|nr:hypothetical protein AG1IA_07115 [Rhizoctonia solani AG-1 IA]
MREYSVTLTICHFPPMLILDRHGESILDTKCDGTPWGWRRSIKNAGYQAISRDVPHPRSRFGWKGRILSANFLLAWVVSVGGGCSSDTLRILSR